MSGGVRREESSPSVRSRWDARYRHGDWADLADPSPILRDAERWLPRGGWALDLACGGGRNAVWLAERGFQVLAVDLSVEGLRRTRERAAAGGLPVWPVLADAGRVQVRPGSMAVAVNTRFLLRSALPLLRSALAPGGILVFETFHADELDVLGGDLRRAFVLERGELLETFGDWEVLLHEEGVFEREEGERGLGRLVARKPGGAGRG